MISEKLRKVENLHIIFWLTKDACWCLLSERIAIAMIFPTVLIAIWMVIKTRRMLSEFAHNLAVLFWISANSIWMYGELTCEDCTRPQALIFFFTGISVLVLYYAYWIYTKVKSRNFS
jgi:hypothetical protein